MTPSLGRWPLLLAGVAAVAGPALANTPDSAAWPGSPVTGLPAVDPPFDITRVLNRSRYDFRIVVRESTLAQAEIDAQFGVVDRSWNVAASVDAYVLRGVDGTIDYYWTVSNGATTSGQETTQRLEGPPVFGYVTETKSIPLRDFGIASFTVTGIAAQASEAYFLEGVNAVRPLTVGADGAGGVSFRFATEGHYEPPLDNPLGYQSDNWLNLDSPLLPGHTSNWLILDTKETAPSRTATFSLSFAGVNGPYLDAEHNVSRTGSSVQFLVLGPSAVPEPSTWALAALGLAGVAWRRRRRTGA